ncbi:hypothetical protein MPSEU_000034500 [Mayamaea pseudoterrestris]|nr:hypothetical protein MPSEU_000034500 [Mayamaea pseudoterrestris]
MSAADSSHSDRPCTTSESCHRDDVSFAATVKISNRISDSKTVVQAKARLLEALSFVEDVEARIELVDIFRDHSKGKTDVAYVTNFFDKHNIKLSMAEVLKNVTTLAFSGSLILARFLSTCAKGILQQYDAQPLSIVEARGGDHKDKASYLPDDTSSTGDFLNPVDASNLTDSHGFPFVPPAALARGRPGGTLLASAVTENDSISANSGARNLGSAGVRVESRVVDNLLPQGMRNVPTANPKDLLSPAVVLAVPEGVDIVPGVAAALGILAVADEDDLVQGGQGGVASDDAPASVIGDFVEDENESPGGPEGRFGCCG